LPRFGKKSDGVAGFSAGKTTDKQPGLVAKENRFCCLPLFGKKSDGVAGFSAGKTTDKRRGWSQKKTAFAARPSNRGRSLL